MQLRTPLIAVGLAVLGSLLLSAQRPDRPREFFTALNGIRFADQFPGATVTAQIDACLADIGPFQNGICLIPAFMGAGAPTAPISSRHLLLDLRGPGFSTGVLNNVLVMDGVKFAQTDAGFQAAINYLPTAGGTIVIPPNTTIALSSNKATGTKVVTFIGSGPTSILRVSGFTGITLASNYSSISNLRIEDVTGDAATILVDVPAAVNRWFLSGVELVGTGDLGTGLRITSAVIGSVTDCRIVDFNIGVSINGAVASLANANSFVNNSIISNTVGVDFIGATSADSAYFFGNTIELNNIGIRTANSTDSAQLVLFGNHLENNAGASPTNLSLGNRWGLMSAGNRYVTAAANRDIVVNGGDGRITSINDHFNSGVTHNGTSTFALIQPHVLPTGFWAGSGVLTTALRSDELAVSNVRDAAGGISAGAGTSAEQVVFYRWLNRTGGIEWELQKDASNNWTLLRSGTTLRLQLSPATDNIYRSGSTTGDHFFQSSNGTTYLSIDDDGLKPSPVAFASLGTPANGTLRYCSDCTIANPCAGGGTGALAKRLNGVWVCN